jgi:hypothetical protein
VDKQQNKTALLENLQECEQGYKWTVKTDRQ